MQKEVREKALRTSVSEGAAAGFSTSIGETYITPYALALKASALYIGVLSAISGLISPLAQLLGSNLMEKHSRKKIVLLFAILQALTWIPIAILGYFFWKGMSSQATIILLIIGYGLFAAFGGVGHPPWFSWMGDLVPENKRGSYFGKRNKAIGAVSIAAVLIGAFLLDAFKTSGFIFLGFAILFGLAFTFRTISYFLLKKQFAPPLHLSKDYYFSLWDFLKRFDNFGKFAVYHALFNFALMIASPFFAVYMLEELHFSYTLFMIVSISSSVFYLIFMPLIGKFSDHYGNRKLFALSCILFSLNPLLWIFIKKPLFLILIPQLISGLANAAFIIGVTNFTYDAVRPERRGLCTAYFNILAGVGIFIGSLLGGILLKYLHTSIAPFVVVFALSALLRFAISFLIVKEIKEVKKVDHLPPMHIHWTHPFKTIHAEIGWLKKISTAVV